MIQKFEEFINEMAIISKVGKKVFADDKELKTMNFTEIQKNMVLYIEEKGNLFWPKGKFFLYFTDSDDTTTKICNGEYDFIQFPIKGYHNLFTCAPITDIWKKSYLKKYKGGDHILGIVEGYHGEGKILIQMMSVHKKFQGHKVNTLMMDTLKDELKGEFL